MGNFDIEFNTKRATRYSNITGRNRKPVSYEIKNIKSQGIELNARLDDIVKTAKNRVNDIDLQINTINARPVPAPKTVGWRSHRPVIDWSETENAQKSIGLDINPLMQQKTQVNKQASEQENEINLELQNLKTERANLEKIQRQQYTNMMGDQTLDSGRGRSSLSQRTRPTRPTKNIITTQNNQSKFKQLGV